MNLFKQQQTSSGYKTIPDAIADDIADADTAAVGHCSSTGRRMALVASTMLLVVLAGGGTVWMGDGGITPTAEGLVVAATEGSDPRACFNAGATFNGKSVYSSQNYQYDTCFQYDHWRQNPGKVHNCWTKSYQCGSRWCTCWPNGIYSKGHGPHMVNANTVTPMTWPLMSCGDPCPFQHQIAD